MNIDLMLIIGLAGFAVTHMLKETGGPGDIFQHIRLWVGADLPIIDSDGKTIVGYRPDDNPSGFITKLYSCYECLTTWVCLLLTLLYILLNVGHTIGAEIALIWLASVGISYMINRLYYWNGDD